MMCKKIETLTSFLSCFLPTPMLRILVLSSYLLLVRASCLADDVCASAADFTPFAIGGGTCCSNSDCTNYTFTELDPTCSGCTGPRYTTQNACNEAGSPYFWYNEMCSELAPQFAQYCASLQPAVLRAGYDCCNGGSGASLSPPSLPGLPSENPCFPSSATVTMADGTLSRIHTLKEGDEIVAATADGVLTTDVVSFLSIANPMALHVDFVVLTTSADTTLTLTAQHHLPVGASCCSTLQRAATVAIGDQLWVALSGKVVAQTVTRKFSTVADGLHSPVLSRGTFPVVDDVVTSFDSMSKVTLARYGLSTLIAGCKATGSCDVVRRFFFSPILTTSQFLDLWPHTL